MSSTKKGLLVGAIMVALSMLLYYSIGSFSTPLQYTVYGIYVIGIVWSIYTARPKYNGAATFKSLFGEGFKCFVVVTLMMVVFTAVFILSHPEMKDEMATLMRPELLKQGNKTPAEIEDVIAQSKKAFLPSFVMAAVLGYLMIGALISLVSAGFLSQAAKHSSPPIRR